MLNRNLLFIICLMAMFSIAGCDAQQEKAQESIPTSQAKESVQEKVFHVFSFDGIRELRYLVHFDGPDQGATIFTSDEVRHLALVPTASGTKYSDDRLMIWLKGQDVLMEVDGKRVGPCKVSGLQSILANAWLSGTTFWAVGNEPSWNLVMGLDRVMLITEMGQTKLEFKGLVAGQLNPKSPAGVYEFSNGQNSLKIEIIEGLCTNIMSGEPFAVSVKLTLNGTEMKGCGTGLF